MKIIIKIKRQIMTKTLTKQQFRQMAFPIKGNGKDIEEPKMQLLPVDKGMINGNMYNIKVEIYEDLVTLTKQG